MNNKIKAQNKTLYEVQAYKEIRDIMLKVHLCSYDHANKSYDLPIPIETTFFKVMNIVLENEKQLGNWREIDE